MVLQLKFQKKKKKSKFKLNFRKNKHTFAKEKTLDVLRTSFNIHRATLTGRSFDTLQTISNGEQNTKYQTRVA